MPDEEVERTLTADQHRRLAAQPFNHVWTLLETPQRTPEQDLRMITRGTRLSVSLGRGGLAREFRTGRVADLPRLSQCSGALSRRSSHAGRCLEHSLAAGLSAFDVAFAHEALSRAHSIAGQVEAAQQHRRLAEEAGARIGAAEDRKLLFADLASIGTG